MRDDEEVVQEGCQVVSTERLLVRPGSSLVRFSFSTAGIDTACKSDAVAIPILVERDQARNRYQSPVAVTFFRTPELCVALVSAPHRTY